MRSLLTITILILAAAVLRAGEGRPAHSADQPIDMEALMPSEEGLIRIDVPGVDSRDFLARFMGDTLFVPFTSFCDFLRIKSSVSPDQNIMSGTLAPEGDFEISRISNSATIGTRTIRVAPSAIRIAGGEVYIEQGLICELLGLAAYYDPVNLKLRISPDEKLPVVQLKRSEERYGLLPSHGGNMQARESFPIDRQFFGAPTLNWTLANSLSGKINALSGTLFYGQQFLWGTLEVTGSASMMTGAENSGRRARIDAARWLYQMPSSSFITQAQIGTIDLTDGSRVHGIGISNTPLSPRTGYSSYILQGLTRPGWTVELYDGNRLVDMTRADDDGRYSFKILMDYGTVDRVTREVGPYGESILSHHRLQFDQTMIPAGELEYDARYGIDSLATHSPAAGSARVGFGIMDRLTIGASANYHTDSLFAWRRDSIVPHALASLWLGESSSLSLDYAIRTKLIGAAYSSVGADNTTYNLAVDSVSIGDRTFSSHASFNIPIGPISAGASGGYAKRSTGNEYSVEPQVSGYVAGISFEASTRLSWKALPFSTEVIAGLSTEKMPAIESSLRLMASPFGGALLSAGGKYDVRSATMTQFDLSGFYQFNAQFGLNVEYSAPRFDWKQGLLQAQLSINLNALRAVVGSFYQNGLTSNSTFAQGGMLLSSHGVKLYADPVVGQSAVMVEAFNDRNGNGVRDDGEEMLDAPKARLTVAESEMMSEDGMFRLLPANRECKVEVDRWSFASEDLYPSRTNYNIYTLPSGVHAIEVPFSHGYDLSGRCGVEGDSAKPGETAAFLNGLRVRLICSGNGATYDGEIFSDGTIFVPGVAAGTYQILFDADQLAARRLCPPGDDGSFTVTDTDHRIPLTLLKRCAK